MPEPPSLAGFLSYARHDDEYGGGRITRLAGDLLRGMRAHSGWRDVALFQDIKTIAWGQPWQRRIREGLEGALLLFPVLSPSFFTSDACLDELEAFLKREEALGRDDLILPLYYLRCPAMDDPDPAGLGPRAREAAQLLRQRNYEDWRALRLTSETDPAYVQGVDRLAERAVEALRRGAPVRAAAAATPPAHGGAATPAAETAPPAEMGPKPTGAPRQVPEVVVHPFPGRGDFASIGEAIRKAPPGARILIQPGHYAESLVMDRPVELVGDGERDEIVVESRAGAALTFDASFGVVRNLAFRQAGDDNFCIWITQGRLDLEDCDITSAGLSCVAVTGGADPRLRRNRIHGGKQSGVLVSKAARGTFEDNDIFGHATACIAVKEKGDPVVRRNRIHDGKSGGVFVYEAGRGTFEDNDIFGNALAGIAVREQGDPVVRRNRIHDGKSSGVFVYERGLGTFEDNDIFGNDKAGIAVTVQGDPVVRRNRITGNTYEAIWVQATGKGTYIGNDLRGNKRGPWDIEAGAEVTSQDNIEK